MVRPGGHYLGDVSFLEPWHDASFFHMSPMGAYELLAQAGMEPVHIWPAKGDSGFKALMGMGNQVTRKLKFLGAGIAGMYDLGNSLRNKLRKTGPVDIADFAKVSGATDWIARRPG